MSSELEAGIWCVGGVQLYSCFVCTAREGETTVAHACMSMSSSYAVTAINLLRVVPPARSRSGRGASLPRSVRLTCPSALSAPSPGRGARIGAMARPLRPVRAAYRDGTEMYNEYEPQDVRPWPMCATDGRQHPAASVRLEFPRTAKGIEAALRAGASALRSSTPSSGQTGTAVRVARPSPAARAERAQTV